MIKLPTKATEVDLSFNKQKFIMIGASGIGKSEFWSQDSKALFIEAEAGLNFIKAMKQPARSWLEIVDIVKALNEATKAPDFPYSVVIVDTLDRIDDYIKDYVILKTKEAYPNKNIQALGDHPKRGVAWDIRRTLWSKFLKNLENLPCAIALVGHLETKKVEEDGQQPYDWKTISIGGKVGGDILAWSDHTLHIQGLKMGDKVKRTIYTVPTKSREAKSRGGVIKSGWIWSENKKENYDKLRNWFK